MGGFSGHPNLCPPAASLTLERRTLKLVEADTGEIAGEAEEQSLAIDEEFSRGVWKILRMIHRTLPVRPPIPPGTVFKTTIGQLLDNSYGALKGARAIPSCCIYIVRANGGDVLYVGMTNYKVYTRIRQHTRNHSSQLGMAIREYAPQSHQWEVEIIKMMDREAGLKEELHIIKELNPRYNQRPGPKRSE